MWGIFSPFFLARQCKIVLNSHIKKKFVLNMKARLDCINVNVV